MVFDNLEKAKTSALSIIYLLTRSALSGRCVSEMGWRFCCNFDPSFFYVRRAELSRYTSMRRVKIRLFSGIVYHCRMGYREVNHDIEKPRTSYTVGAIHQLTTS